MPLELRKLMNKTEPELQNYYFPVFDEASREEFVNMNELKSKLFEAKWNWHKEQTFNRYQITNQHLEEEGQIADEYDAWMKNRVEFMYDYLDFDNDRARVRSRFMTEMHKKTTVKDIGEKLDEFILDSKAAIAPYWDMGKHVLEEPKAP